MVNSGVEPNVHTYGALIDGCARAGQVGKAFGAYGILRSKVQFLQHFSKDLYCHLSAVLDKFYLHLLTVHTDEMFVRSRM